MGSGGARRGAPAGGHLQGIAGGLEGGRVHGPGQVVEGVAGAPVGHARRVGLGVVLEGQESPGPPGVNRGAVGGGQQGGGLGQLGDGVVVGDDDGQAGAVGGGDSGAVGGADGLGCHGPEDRVTLAGGRDGQLDDADLVVAQRRHGRGAPEGLGGHLGAQADGDGGDVVGDDAAQQLTQVRQPGVLALVVGAHGAAQHNEAVADLVQGGDGLAPPGAHHAQGGTLGEEPLPQAPHGRELLGLDDGDRERVSHGHILPPVRLPARGDRHRRAA